MSTTTRETPTLEELRARLADQEAEARAAEGELGAATRVGPNIKTVWKKVIEVQAALQGTRAAISELERRQQAQAEHQAQMDTARSNLAIYEWIAEYISRAEDVADRAAELKTAEAHLAGAQRDVRGAIAFQARARSQARPRSAVRRRHHPPSPKRQEGPLAGHNRRRPRTAHTQRRQQPPGTRRRAGSCRTPKTG